MCYTSVLYFINSIILEMILEVGKDQGHIVIDDNTGRIMSVLVKEGVKGKFDFKAYTSYKREGNKHYNIRDKKTYNKSSNGE